MNLPFYQNAVKHGMVRQPEEMYRQAQQAVQDDLWENTAILDEIEEQDDFGPLAFHKVEAWLAPVVGVSSTGLKNGEDFIKLVFRDIDHPTWRGRYYKYDNNYWLGDYADIQKSVQKYMTARRCNNWLRCVDPENGSIFSIPCVIDYDMTSPSVKVSSYLLTPNNCAHVMVQANEDTVRLFTLNKRFMLAGRPFKLYAFQNTMMVDEDNSRPTLLYFDMYLDELHDKDDIENQLADNGDYEYSVNLNVDTMTLAQGATGVLTAVVTLNGEVVDKDIVWSTDDATVVTVDENGALVVLGEVGAKVVITATLVGNPSVFGSCEITVGNISAPEVVVLIDGLSEQIRQYETVEITVRATYGGVVYDSIEANVIMDADFFTVKRINNNKFAVTCLKFDGKPHSITVDVSNDNPAFAESQEFSARAVSMMG